jgi:RNAse (barnase) inhibitor barstar
MKPLQSFFQVKNTEEYPLIKGKIILDREQNLVELDGMTLKNKFDVFNAFSSSLHFPRYFGEDWTAFSDCLRDLSWLDNKNCAILLRNASQIEPSLLEAIADAVEEARAHWAEEDVVFEAYVFV